MSKKICNYCYGKFEEEDMVGCDVCKFSCVECYKKQKQQKQEQQSKCSLIIKSLFPYFLVSVICLTIIMPALQINKIDYLILQSILAKYPYHFYAYGSRVKGVARKFSDLDICFKENIPSYKVVELEEELENSDLPFMVELVSWENISSVRQKNIQKDLTLISCPNKLEEREEKNKSSCHEKCPRKYRDWKTNH